MPQDRRLDDASLEGCMMDALRAMPSGFIPESTLILRSVPGHARSVLGSVTTLPQLIEHYCGK
jgi:hypothetical protein